MTARVIHRGNLQDVRQQISETVMKWPLVKKVVEPNEVLEIPVNYQLIVYRDFDIQGTVDIDGELVIIDEVV
jgi:hypothetical protein